MYFVMSEKAAPSGAVFFFEATPVSCSCGAANHNFLLFSRSGRTGPTSAFLLRGPRPRKVRSAPRFLFCPIHPDNPVYFLFRQSRHQLPICSSAPPGLQCQGRQHRALAARSAHNFSFSFLCGRCRRPCSLHPPVIPGYPGWYCGHFLIFQVWISPRLLAIIRGCATHPGTGSNRSLHGQPVPTDGTALAQLQHGCTWRFWVGGLCPLIPVPPPLASGASAAGTSRTFPAV